MDMINKCKSNNILNIYRILENDTNFLIEKEFYETNMYKYIIDNGPLNSNKELFKHISIDMDKTLKIFYENKIIHRKIKTSSIFLKKMVNMK